LVEPERFGLVRLLAGVLSPFTRTLPPKGAEEGFLGAPYLPLSWIRALGRWRDGLERRTPAGSVPVLVLRGDADGFLDEKAQDKVLSRLFPRLELHDLPGVGHIVFDLGSGQDLAVEKIIQFLRGVGATVETDPRETGARSES